jgi:hypothetical protein
MSVDQGIRVWEMAPGPKYQLGLNGNVKKSKGNSKYMCLGTSSEFVAYNSILALAPLALDYQDVWLIRQDLDLDQVAPNAWEGKVSYGADEDKEDNQDPPTPGTWHYSFDTSGGTHKITQSLKNIARLSSSQSDPAPDLLGGIGWDGKKFDGCEIVVPKLELTITAFYAPDQVTKDFIASLSRNTGKTNVQKWLGWEAGELLYVGCSGKGDIPTVRGQRVQPVSIDLKFWVSENKKNFQIPETGDRRIDVPSKKGWEYIWVYYQMDELDKRALPRPRYVYVEKVYDEWDFAGMFGFGG